MTAAGLATTSAPSLAPTTTTPRGLTVTLPTDGSAPGTATLTCAIDTSSGISVAHGSCASGSFTWTPTSPAPGTYTARIIQPSSLASPASPTVTI